MRSNWGGGLQTGWSGKFLSKRKHLTRTVEWELVRHRIAGGGASHTEGTARAMSLMKESPWDSGDREKTSVTMWIVWLCEHGQGEGRWSEWSRQGPGPYKPQERMVLYSKDYRTVPCRRVAWSYFCSKTMILVVAWECGEQGGSKKPVKRHKAV